MLNNLTITELELIDMFANIEGHYSDLVTWEDNKLEHLLRHAQQGDLVDEKGVVPLPIILRLQPQDQMNTVTHSMCEVLIEHCKVPVTVVVPGSLVTFSRIQTELLEKSNVTLIADKALRVVCADMVLKRSTHLKFPIVNELTLQRSVIDSNFEQKTISKLLIVNCSKFDNLEKISAINVTIKYSSTDEIPTHWHMFSRELKYLHIGKQTKLQLFKNDPPENICVIPVEKINNIAKYFTYIGEFALRVGADKFSGPIKLVSFALVDIGKFAYKIEDDEPSLLKALNVWCIYRDDIASLGDVLNLQEALIEHGLSKYAK